MTRKLSRIVAGFATIAAVTLIGATPAMAHGTVSSTTPADASQVNVAPSSIVIEFNELVTISPTAIRVVNSAGSDVAVDAPVNMPNGTKATVSARFTDPLQPGWYAVSWNAISADGHPISSTFTFTYGASDAAAGQTAADVLDDPSAPFRTASGVLRVIGYFVTLLAIGMLIATWPLAPVPAAAEAARKGAAWAASAGLVVTPLILLNNAILLNGGGFDNLKTTALIALQSNTGTALLVRVSALFGLCTAVLLAAERSTRWVAAGIGLISAAGLAVSYALAGHSTVVKWELVAAPSLVVHLIAGAAWLGGLPAVAWAFRKRSSLSDLDVATVVGRFSVVATISVVAVFIAGLTLSITMFTSPTQITGDYGTTLLVKIATVVVIAALGAYNHFVAVPGLRKAARAQANNEGIDGIDDTGTGTGGVAKTTGTAKSGLRERRHLGTILKVEAFAVVVVAILTGVVTNNAAPAAGGSHNAHQGVDGGGHSGGSMIDGDLQLALADLEPRTVLVPLNDGELQIDYRPARADRENLFTFTTTAADGSVLTPQSVTVIATHPATGLGPIERSAQSNGNGTFGWSTRDLGIPGDWQLEVRVTFDAVSTGVATATVTIRASALIEPSATTPDATTSPVTRPGQPSSTPIGATALPNATTTPEESR